NLTTFSGDNKAWPIYLLLSNSVSTVHKKPSTLAMIIVALLPIPPKYTKQQKAAQADAQRQVNRYILHLALEQVLMLMCNPRKYGNDLPCADGKVWNHFSYLFSSHG